MDDMVRRIAGTDIERVKEIYEDDRHYQYHVRQYESCYRSTAHLREFAGKHVQEPEAPYRIIDVACGGGANIYHLSGLFPNSSWVGLDWADKFFNIGHEYLGGKKLDYKLVKGDYFKLEETFGRESFDVVFSIQTLLTLPDYEQALENLLAITRQWLFITSLFTDFDVDIVNNVYQYPDEEWEKRAAYYNYNIYSIKRFAYFCKKLGASVVSHEDFIMDIDLPRPENRLMGTYTMKNEVGARMQFSGPLYMPWKAVAIRKTP